MSHLQIGINGLGRIGRLVCRLGFDSLNIQAINGRCSAQTAAHLLKYDSVHGTWDREVGYQKNALIIERRAIPYFQEEKTGKYSLEETWYRCGDGMYGSFQKTGRLTKTSSGWCQKGFDIRTGGRG